MGVRLWRSSDWIALKLSVELLAIRLSIIATGSLLVMSAYQRIQSGMKSLSGMLGLFIIQESRSLHLRVLATGSDLLPIGITSFIGSVVLDVLAACLDPQ